MIHRTVQHGLIRSVIFAAAAVVALPGLAGAQDNGPVIDSVTFHEDTSGRYMVVYPEFHFHDPSGTVRFIHRELVSTNSPKPTSVKDGVIDISASKQTQGATYVGGWPCGPENFYVKLRAFIMNLDGAKSNTVEYTVHCNGG